MSFRAVISHGLHQIQRTFFPDLKHEAGPIPKSLIKLSHILQTIHSFNIGFPKKSWTGRPPKCRRAIFNALIAKAFLQIPTTAHLIERLRSDKHLCLICGFEWASQVPSNSIFSRVFKEFSEMELPQKAHELLVKESYSGKIVGHISRDATAIEAREKPKKKVKKKIRSKRRGRPRKGEEKKKEPTRLEKQFSGLSLEAMIDDLPKDCDVGSKKNSKGYTKNWIGYKLHLDTTDHGIPVSALLTSASVHDSQVAIPMATITEKRVKNFYDLMDSAYDAPEIKSYSRKINHVPLIAPNPRRDTELKRNIEEEVKAQNTLNWKPSEEIRYENRTVAERANARLKDEFGARNVRVRGPTKVFCHLAIGLLVLSADQLMRLLT